MTNDSSSTHSPNEHFEMCILSTFANNSDLFNLKIFNYLNGEWFFNISLNIRRKFVF